MNKQTHSWWLDLRHGGLLISSAVFSEVFPNESSGPGTQALHYLREKYNRFAQRRSKPNASDTSHKHTLEFTDYLMETFLKMHQGRWLKWNEIPPDLVTTTILREHIKPHRLYYLKRDDEVPFLAVFPDNSQRVGYGKGRAVFGRMLKYLRDKRIPFGVLTNGAQLRLCYAAYDSESWAEWDISDWFEGAENLHSLYGLYMFLGPDGLQPRDGYEIPLLEAVESSRTRQGELSTVLAEQVRNAIELLVEQLNQTAKRDTEFLQTVRQSGAVQLPESAVLNAVFQSAVRIIMRMVVVLFAEARDLFPRSSEVYHRNYGIEGLFEQLRSGRLHESTDYMDEQTNGWLRLMALFRIISYGSPHPDLQMPRYGGELFAPGNSNSSDPVSRALALFEDPRLEVNNATLLKILENLKYGTIRIKKGRTTIPVRGPVSFADLRTEYIGIIYEGVLDLGLRAAEDTMLLINAGNQPILPLSVLEQLSPSQICTLFEGIETFTESTDEPAEEEAAEPLSSQEEEPEWSESDVQATDAAESEGSQNEKAESWAVRAAEALKLVKKGKGAFDQFEYQNRLKQKARTLVKKIYAPGDYYLSLWSGNRKGSGTFYTKPQLAVPTVRRALKHLLYTTDESDILVPKLPEEILSVKVCDNANGSGSFLVAATLYITDVLYESLSYHCRLLDATDAKGKALPLGNKPEHPTDEVFLPCMPDDEHFEERVKARLKRYVVENCIYGVDHNPMAVELARLSLWIETMDRELPFEFLDHKIKTGNSLVGGWLDTFLHYPLAAWQRKGGDESHPSNMFHEPKSWDKLITQKFRSVILPEMESAILSGRQTEIAFAAGTSTHLDAHRELLDLYLSMHNQPFSIHGADTRNQMYYGSILQSEAYLKLKQRMDIWCALWFWPADQLDAAPTPNNFSHLSEESLAIVVDLAARHRFFHWEVEFPDVFCSGRNGFDAVLGNPPWEISKPNSQEFFTKVDPLYRSYGKQEAIRKQKDYFRASPDLEISWLRYNAGFKAMSNYFSSCHNPFGDPDLDQDTRINLGTAKRSKELHSIWRTLRSRAKTFTADFRHPYRHQGSADLNLYKLFLEASYHLLKRYGRIGMIVPSGVYSDKGAQPLRKLFLEESGWEWLFCFENRGKIFDIDSRFKFAAIIIQKGGSTGVIRTAFMRHRLSDWEHPENMIGYSPELVRSLSPQNLSFLELTSSRDAEIIKKMYRNSILLGDESENGWGMEYGREFDMTNDSGLFNKLEDLQKKGFKPDPYGRMIGLDGTMMLPLYQGVMIWQFDFCAASYLSGAGKRTEWDRSKDIKTIRSQFYIKSEDFYPEAFNPFDFKFAFRDISAGTNERTAIGTPLCSVPCGNVLGLLRNRNNDYARVLLLGMFMNSFPFDFVVRQRMVGSHLNLFVLRELPLLDNKEIENHAPMLIYLALAISCPDNYFSLIWIWYKHSYKKSLFAPQAKFALTPHERIRIRAILDAAVAELYGLEYEDFEWILSDDRTNPKGFWRVDKEKPAEVRHTTLALLAFRRVKEVGLEAFLNEDWQLPGYAAEYYGPRYLDWQLTTTAEQSWAELEYHARQLLGEEGYEEFIRHNEHGPKKEESLVKSANKPVQSGKPDQAGTDPEQLKLF